MSRIVKNGKVNGKREVKGHLRQVKGQHHQEVKGNLRQVKGHHHQEVKGHLRQVKGHLAKRSSRGKGLLIILEVI